MILERQENQPVFVIGGRHLNNIHWAGDTLLTGKSERKLNERLDIIVDKSKKGLIVKCRKIECTLFKGTTQGVSNIL